AGRVLGSAGAGRVGAGRDGGDRSEERGEGGEGGAVGGARAADARGGRAGRAGEADVGAGEAADRLAEDDREVDRRGVGRVVLARGLVDRHGRLGRVVGDRVVARARGAVAVAGRVLGSAGAGRVGAGRDGGD